MNFFSSSNRHIALVSFTLLFLVGSLHCVDTQSVEEQNAIAREGSKALQEKQLDLAYDKYMQVLRQNPCHSQATGGLLKIANSWSQNKKFKHKALKIYQHLLKCQPNNTDILYYMARLESWLRKDKSARKHLNYALRLAPNNGDAATLLVNLYIRDRKYKEAMALICEHPHIENKDQKLANIAFRRRRYKRAITYYNSFLEKEPKNDLNYRDLMYVKANTDPSIYVEGSYVKAKEDDPDLRASVVKDFYTLATYHLNFPLANCYRMQFKEYFFSQKERDIYIPLGTNYHVIINAVQQKNELFLMKHFTFDILFRFLFARGINNNVFFPFSSTWRFEPGGTIKYADHLQTLSLNSHVESFIYKHIKEQRTGLMTTVYLNASYVFRPEMFLYPKIGASFDEVYYHDSIHNRRNTTNLWSELSLYKRNLKFTYLFENSHFKDTTDNYYSFKRQFRNTLGGILHIDFTSYLYLEGIYQHRWEFTIGLNQPIGFFVFSQERQRLQSNKVIIRGGWRLKDKLRIEALGHYFKSTLPYRDFLVQGNITI